MAERPPSDSGPGEAVLDHRSAESGSAADEASLAVETVAEVGGRRRRRTPTPILAAVAADRFLPWLLAPMALLATLALAAALALASLADHWDTGLAGTLTVQVPPTGDAAETEARVDAVIDRLRGLPGVRTVRPLTEDERIRLLAPWLGTGDLIDQLPMPALVDVQLDPTASINIPALQVEVGVIAPGTIVDDHSAWLQDLTDLIDAARWLAAAALGTVVAAAMATVAFATRAGMAVQHGIVGLLHQMGADDRFVAGRFERHIGGLAGTGAMAGFGAALAILVGLTVLRPQRRDPLLPGLDLAIWHWPLLLLVPLLLVALSRIMARWVALRTLTRLY